MNIIKNLQFVVVGKFLYGWPELEELQSQIPKQCRFKGGLTIDLLRNRYILIRCYREEDFVSILFKKNYYFLR